MTNIYRNNNVYNFGLKTSDHSLLQRHLSTKSLMSLACKNSGKHNYMLCVCGLNGVPINEILAPAP